MVHLIDTPNVVLFLLIISLLSALNFFQTLNV